VRAVGAVDVHDVDPALAPVIDAAFDPIGRLVGRVVEHLDFEPGPRVVEPGTRVDQPRGDVGLVVKRKLHGNHRPGIIGSGQVVRIGHRARTKPVVTYVLHGQPQQVASIEEESGDGDGVEGSNHSNFDLRVANDEVRINSPFDNRLTSST